MKENLSVLLRSPAYDNRFRSLLKDRSDQFTSSILQIGASMPDVEPRSIIAAAMTAAALDLPINKNLGYAWLVPYNDSQRGCKLAQFQMGWRGYVQLALRTGRYTGMNARTVNVECFSGWDDLGQPKIEWTKHNPDLPVWGYWFGFDLLPAMKQRFLWTKERAIAHARRFSQSFRSGAKIWKENEDPMLLKTVVKNELSKWGILSIEMHTATERDGSIQVEPDAPVEYLDNGDEQKTLDGGGSGELGPQSLRVESVAVPASTNPSPTPPSVPLASGELSREGSTSLATPPDAPVAAPRRGRPPKVEPQKEMFAPQASPVSQPQPLVEESIGDTPQDKLCEWAMKHSISFEQFRAAIIRNQWPVRDVDSMSSWDELPTRICGLWLRSGDDLLKEIVP